MTARRVGGGLRSDKALARELADYFLRLRAGGAALVLAIGGRDGVQLRKKAGEKMAVSRDCGDEAFGDGEKSGGGETIAPFAVVAQGVKAGDPGGAALPDFAGVGDDDDFAVGMEGVDAGEAGGEIGGLEGDEFEGEIGGFPAKKNATLLTEGAFSVVENG